MLVYHTSDASFSMPLVYVICFSRRRTVSGNEAYNLVASSHHLAFGTYRAPHRYHLFRVFILHSLGNNTLDVVHGSTSVRTTKKSLPRRIQTQLANPKHQCHRQPRNCILPTRLPRKVSFFFLCQRIAPHLYQVDLQLKSRECVLKRPAKEARETSTKRKKKHKVAELCLIMLKPSCVLIDVHFILLQF